MLNIQINNKKIRKLELNYRGNFDGDLIDFLELDNVSYRDKIWTAVNCLPRFIVEVFALDCAVHAADIAANSNDKLTEATSYATHVDVKNKEKALLSVSHAIARAADAIVYVAHAVDHAAEVVDTARTDYADYALFVSKIAARHASITSNAARLKEQERQLEALKHLIRTGVMGQLC